MRFQLYSSFIAEQPGLIGRFRLHNHADEIYKDRKYAQTLALFGPFHDNLIMLTESVNLTAKQLGLTFNS